MGSRRGLEPGRSSTRGPPTSAGATDAMTDGRSPSEERTAVQSIVSMVAIDKRFGPVRANDKVDLTLYPGEIHAVLGENGAGKTTLMNILSGMYQPDGGSITLDGKPVTIGSPSEALALGIGTVYQHFTLVPNLSVI